MAGKTVRWLASVAVASLVVALVVGALVSSPAIGQDRTDERLAALEAQVAELEDRVAALEGDDASAEPSGATHTITGSIDLIDPDETWTFGRGCSGDDGFDDLREGADVRVYDGARNLIANGRLDAGEATGTHICRFPFTVEDVPEVDFYEIEIANRAGPSWSLEDMEENEWQVELTIGT